MQEDQRLALPRVVDGKLAAGSIDCLLHREAFRGLQSTTAHGKWEAPRESSRGRRRAVTDANSLPPRSNGSMRIAEVFHSIQGEGRLTGVPSVFVRTSGCNLRCWFCDTPYTSWNPEGDDRTVESLIDEVLAFPAAHTVITGGEPMLVKDVVDLAGRLKEAGKHITIETAGTVDLDVPADLMSISPKRANSTPAAETGWAERHDARRHRPEVIRRLTTDYDYQLKFVVDRPEDIDDVASYLAEFPHLDPGKVYLMPQAIDRAPHAEKCSWLGDAAAKRGWQLCRRLHIELFGNKRGT